jgi:MFS family permease
MPTTIFDMIWGVRYLQEAHGFDYGSAVMRSATVPIGWIIGCPLLGFISDRLGRRKPVIMAGAVVLLGCLAWILFGPLNILFTFSAWLAPVFGWILQRVSGGATEMQAGHYQTAFVPLLFGVALAVILSLLLKETGPAVRTFASSVSEE